MSHGRWVWLLLGMVALTGCPTRPKYDIEGYPGAMQRKADPNIVAKEGTLFLYAEGTPDSTAQVEEHYRRTLAKARGWTESHPRDGITLFTDGNMQISSEFDFNGPRPTDPSTPGGTVVVFDRGGSGEVRVFRYVPMPKE